MLLTFPISADGAAERDLSVESVSGVAIDAGTAEPTKPRFGFTSKLELPASKSEETNTRNEGDSSGPTPELAFSPDASRASVGTAAGSRPRHTFVAAVAWGTAPNTAAVNAFAPLSGRRAIVPPALAVGGPVAADTVQQSQALEHYGNLPLSFEANHGQTDASVDFIARTGGSTVFLTPTAAVFSITQSASVDALARRDLAAHGGLTPRRSPEKMGDAVYMQILGANPDAQPTAVNRQPGIVNYFIGNDPNQWHANIPTFGGVEYQDVYPGIDLVYYGNDGQLEYDFVVSPGADADAIALNFAGADGADINATGDLVLQTVAGDVVHQKPYLYQEIDGARHVVAGDFVLNSALRTPHSALVSFDIGAYDSSRPLVIDPVVLGYSAFMGASEYDRSFGIAADRNGSAYVTGETHSPDFPTTPGAFDTTNNSGDGFVSKLNVDGSALVYSSFLGGSSTDYGYGIAVDGSGNAYVTGWTGSTGFPTTSGAFDTTFNGIIDAFVTKLNAAGSALVYSTFLGGSQDDRGEAIALDGNGNAYVTGWTLSSGFPKTTGAFDTSYNSGFDGFVTKLNAVGSALAYSTYLGGSADDYGFGIDVDAGGNAYVTGRTSSSNFPTTTGAFDKSHSGGAWDVYVTKLNAAGSAPDYSSFLGGFGDDEGHGVALDRGGNAYVSGRTASSNFPTTPGAFDTSYNGGSYSDVFVTKFNADGSALAHSTFLGGSGNEEGFGIAVDVSGNAYMTGWTDSSNFPTTPGAYDTTHNSGLDVLVTKLNPDGSALAYSTFLGGSGSYDGGWAIAVDGSGNAYVTGQTDSFDFPTTPQAFDTSLNGGHDGFVTKFSGFVDLPVTAKGNV